LTCAFVLILAEFPVSGDVSTLGVAAGASLVNPKTTDNTGVVVSAITLGNDQGGGFTLDVSSLKTGKLVRHNGTSYETDTIDGNVVNYIVSLVYSSGTLGTVAPSPSLPTAHELATSISLSFVADSPTRNTVAYVLNLEMTTTANDKQFQGTFRDDLTFTLTDQ